MPSERLKAAMKATQYSHQKVAKPSEFTGWADEVKAVPRKPKAARPPVERIRPGSKRANRVRETTTDEVNRNSVEGDELLEPSGDVQAQGRAIRSKLPPDPFPLQYIDGDPDKEFECE